MKIRLFFVFTSLLLIFSCDDEFIVNADYKDITIVYGLINPSQSDSIHYIKINKAFLNERNNALEIAKILDSIYYKDSLTVSLIEYKNGVKINTIYLYKILNSQKDSGIFAYPNQYLYRTPKVKLDPESVYHLEIFNPKNGHLITSRTEIVGDLIPDKPKNGNLVTFNPATEFEFSWTSGRNAYFYDLFVDIYYTENLISDPNNKIQKKLTWSMFTYKLTNSLAGNSKVNYRALGQTFYDYLGAYIPVDPQKQRTLDKFEFIFSSGGKEIYYYINVNKPSIGTVQKKPEYSNITNGYGIFSSRNQTRLICYPSGVTINNLKINTKTEALNFK